MFKTTPLEELVGSLNVVRHNRAMIEQELNERLDQDHAECSFTVVGPKQERAYWKFPDLPTRTEPGIHIWQSPGSMTWERGNQPTDRYIQERYAVQTPFGPDSGSRINRLLVTKIVDPRHRIKWGDLDRYIRHPPRFAIPGDYHEMSRVDIKSCYYRIICILGIYPELNYSKRVFGVWDRIEDWYPYADNKPVRNSLYGMVFQPTVMHVNSKGRKLIAPQPENKVTNPALHQLVQIIVNDIGRFAEKLGSPHWHTDGGLIPQERAKEFYEFVGGVGGLPVRSIVGEGEASVYGVGRYWCEGHECKGSKVLKAGRFIEEEFEGIRWLKERISYWVLVRGKPEVIWQEVEKKENG